MKKIVAVFLAIALTTAAHARSEDDLQHNMPSRAGHYDPDLVYAGSAGAFKVMYDKNITRDTRRKQGTVYVLIEANQPRDFTFQDENGAPKVYRYRYMVQRTDVDCGRGIYIADFVTYFNADNGSIIQEASDGTPYKVNGGSPMGAVYRAVCGGMQ